MSGGACVQCTAERAELLPVPGEIEGQCAAAPTNKYGSPLSPIRPRLVLPLPPPPSTHVSPISTKHGHSCITRASGLMVTIGVMRAGRVCLVCYHGQCRMRFDIFRCACGASRHSAVLRSRLCFDPKGFRHAPNLSCVHIHQRRTLAYTPHHADALRAALRLRKDQSPGTFA